MSQKSVTMIPATVNPYTSVAINDIRKRRAAGYARVSTDHDEQLTSYEAQVDYYTKYIKSREDWEFVCVYTDEGISATSTAKREGFNRMVADALGGGIDLIVTKSVSRFARNTVDSLSTIRKLKEKGVEVYFEKENIWTFDGKGELLITIMSSLAQEESRSISENCTWGQRKRFADGKVSVPYNRFLGYDKGENDTLKVNEGEAVLVRRIYSMFIEGSTPYLIARRLTDEGIPSPSGKRHWNQTTVKRMLTNEKYRGDALLQKTYTVDYLTKKKKVNEGEVPRYYVENSHEAIIEPAVFEMVQREMELRNCGASRYSGVGIFANRIKCGGCGSWYGSKVWHSTSKYRRTIYQCNRKFKNADKCKTPHIDEESIKRMYVAAANRLIKDREEVLASLAVLRDEILATGELEKELSEMQSEVAVAAELIQKCVEENARVALDQTEYQERYDALVARYNAAKARYDEVSGLVSSKKARGEAVDAYMQELSEQEGLLAEFDERLWVSLVDHVTVYGRDDIRFTFKDGREIRA